MIEQYVTQAEFRRLMSTLLAVVGGITIFALFAFIVVPGLRNANKPPAEPSVAAPQGETGWLDPTEYPPVKGYELAPVDPKTVLEANPSLLDRGQTLYQQNCGACHGERGQGNGPASQGLNPPPRNFTNPDGWKNGYQLTAIYRTLAEGISGSSMVAYDYLPAKDRMALSHYVQSLGSFPRDPEDPVELQALAKQFASAGEKVPNKIPVSMAIEKLEAEFRAAAPLPDPGDDEQSPATRLFDRAVRDRARAAQTLALARTWRKSAAALAQVVTLGAPGNGFSAAVATLSPAEWQLLYIELVKTSPR